MTRSVLRNREQTHADSAPRRAIQFGRRNPSGLSSPIARWAVNLLALGGAAMLVWSAVAAVLLLVRPPAKPL